MPAIVTRDDMPEAGVLVAEEYALVGRHVFDQVVTVALHALFYWFGVVLLQLEFGLSNIYLLEDVGAQLIRRLRHPLLKQIFLVVVLFQHCPIIAGGLLHILIHVLVQLEIPDEVDDF